MSHRKVSYSYLLELLEDYKQKLVDPRWEWMKPITQELIHQTEYKIHNIREQELCTHFQGERILASISQTMNCHC